MDEVIINPDYQSYLGLVVTVNYAVGNAKMCSIGELVEISEECLHLKTKDEAQVMVKISEVVSMWEVPS